MFTTFPEVFGTQYHFNAGLAGLAYIGLGIGNVTAMGFSAKLSDKIMLSRSRKQNKGQRPESRLILMGYGGPLIAVGLFWYGWAAEYRDHWIVPMLGTVVLGAGMLITAVSLLCNLSENRLLIIVAFRKPLHDRCFHSIRSIGPSWLILSAFSMWRTPPPRRKAPFQLLGSGMGSFCTCFRFISYVHYTPCADSLWRETERTISS